MRNFNLLLFIVIQIVPKIFGSIAEDDLVIQPEQMDYKTAVEMCKSKGMNLIKIQDDETNKAVVDFAKKKNLTMYWIDGNDIEKEGEWKYDDGSKMSFSKWQKGEPNNYRNEDCIEGYSENEFWNDVNCCPYSSVICYKEKPAISFRKELIGTHVIAISVSITYQNATYDEAVNICRLNNLTLLRIDNEKNDRIVHNITMTNKLGSYWIDGTDRMENGTFIDSDGHLLKYNNFEPGRSKSSESGHCIRRTGEIDSYWDIVSCSSINAVLCLNSQEVKSD